EAVPETTSCSPQKDFFASLHAKSLRTFTCRWRTEGTSQISPRLRFLDRKVSESKGLCGKSVPNQEFTQLIQYDTICSDYMLTRTTYSSTVAIPEAVKIADFGPGQPVLSWVIGAATQYKTGTAPLAGGDSVPLLNFNRGDRSRIPPGHLL